MTSAAGVSAAADPDLITGPHPVVGVEVDSANVADRAPWLAPWIREGGARLNGLLGLLPPVEGSVACGPGTHRVSWIDGALHVPDHEDPEGERILAAFGGAPAGCIALLEAWHRCLGDVAMLPALTRLGDRVRSTLAGGEVRPGVRLVGGITAALSSTIRQGRLPRRSATHPGSVRDVREDLLLLLAAGGGVVDRMVAQAVAQWASRAEAEAVEVEAWPVLREVATTRAAAAMAQWVGAESTAVAVDLIDAHGSPALRPTGQGWELAVPVGWLARVWAPGLAVTAGRFVLDATLARDVQTGDTLHLSAVDATGAAAQLVLRPGA